MKKLLLIVMVMVVVTVMAACSPSSDQAAEIPAITEPMTAVQPADTVGTQEQSEQQASDINVEELTNQRCSECHTMARVRNTTKTPEEWASTVKRMQGKGMSITAEEFDVIVAFLAENYK